MSATRSFTYEASSEADTDRLGVALADALPAQALVTLRGPLGAGKTRLVRALATACGVDPATVVSPTFVLVQEYHGRRKLFHFDAYRIADDDEFLALGPEEYFAAEGVTLIEWAERVARCLPAEYLEIALEETGPTARRVELIAHGPTYAAVLPRVAAVLGIQPVG